MLLAHMCAAALLTGPSCSMTFTDVIKLLPHMFEIDLLSTNAENDRCCAP